tara:strand:+ start:101 stop:544 length:444 start_codon:yes stop_codon:yes gene_type:complete
MKKIILMSALLFSFNGWAADSMISLSDYLEQNEQYMDDLNVGFYFNTRCSAINLNMVDLSANKPELVERGQMVSDYFTRNAIKIRQSITPEDTDTEHLNDVIASVSGMANAYVEVMNINYPKTGMYFTDWMLEDLSLCSSYYDMDSK